MSVKDGGLLLSLARSLQVDIFVHWLELTDIGRLDSAICSKAHRESFLDILHEDYCIFERGFRYCLITSFLWTLKRSVKMTHAQIYSDCTEEEQRQYFTLSGKHTLNLTNENITGDNFDDPLRCEILSVLIGYIAAMCPKITQLQLEDSNFYGNHIDTILINCPHLTRIQLNSNRNMQLRLLEGIWNTPNNVTHLDVADTSYDLDSVECELEENHTLHTLYAADQGEGQCILPFILSCRSLRVLEVDGLTFENLVEVLTECPTLTALSVGLHLEEGDHLGDDEIATLLPLIQNLSALNLYLSEAESAMEVDEWTALTIIQNCPKLRSLLTAPAPDRETFLKFSSVESDAGVNGDKTGAHLLDTLELNTLSPETLRTIVTLCPHLSSLSVENCTTQGTDLEIDAFFEVIGQSEIQKLVLGNCQLVSSKHVQCLRNLTSLSLAATEELTNADVVGIVDRNPKLTALHFLGSRKLSKTSLLYILKHCLHLTELSFNSYNVVESFGQDRGKGKDMELIYGLIGMYHPTLQRECVYIEL